MKYHQNESPYRKISILKENSANNNGMNKFLIRPRALTTTTSASLVEKKKHEEKTLNFDGLQERRRHSLGTDFVPENGPRQRNFSTEQWLYSHDKTSTQNKQVKQNNHPLISELDETEDFENWKLTINEAITNSLLMFFAGYETTSSAIAFCCKVLSIMPEQREKLLDEIAENFEELNFNFEKHRINSLITYDREERIEEDNEDSSTSASSSSSSNTLIDEDDDDDVFENDKNNHFSPPETTKTAYMKKHKKSELDSCNDLYEAIE
jgi:hypothetical protein